MGGIILAFVMAQLPPISGFAAPSRMGAANRRCRTYAQVSTKHDAEGLWVQRKTRA